MVRSLLRSNPYNKGYAMYPSVTSVIPREDYLLDITFNNGENGTLDMKPYLDFGVFNRIKDYSSFKKVSVAFDTIEWEAGVDLDPEFVYDKCGNSK
jgi:PhoPQ-activated pathogenicity-related protein